MRYITLLLMSLILCSCGSSDNSSTYSDQFKYLIEYTDDNKTDQDLFPRSINPDGSVRMVNTTDWTCGFFAGALWYLNELDPEPYIEYEAKEYTYYLSDIQYFSGHHDVGFMIEGSYGNAIKFTGNHSYDSLIVNAAKSLSKRYREKVGAIQSWDTSWNDWSCPVIIDNMMNLELLFHATEISGDSSFYNIAVNHANTTLNNHFREDYSSYHLVDFDINTGEVLKKQTVQGLADESAWARGQAWGLYGYTVCYRFTKDPKYLEQAQHIADYMINHPNLPDDHIPYWDYNADDSKRTPRDVAAAAITASALLELIKYDQNQTYAIFADSILKSLNSPVYLAKNGENHGFLLKHATGHFPANSEIDVPLIYADYYFLEALYEQLLFL